MKKIILILLLGMILLNGCMNENNDIIEGQDKDVIVSFNEEFKLKLDQTGIIKDEKLEIKVTRVVDDSRCPTGVQCVWEGEATVLISLNKNKELIGEYELSTIRNLKDAGDYTLKLVDVEPYPKEGDEKDFSNYIINLAISKFELKKVEGKFWVAISPTQCFSNSWERAWLAENGDKEYPNEDEPEIIKEFYNKIGIEVYEVISRQTFEIVCEACICSRGDTLYLLIDDKSLNSMIDLGYRTAV